MSAKPIPDMTIENLSEFLPKELRQLTDIQTAIPRIAKDVVLIELIRKAVASIPTRHVLVHGDAREMPSKTVGTAHLIVTSPPYWTLKEYRSTSGQLGHVRITTNS